MCPKEALVLRSYRVLWIEIFNQDKRHWFYFNNFRRALREQPRHKYSQPFVATCLDVHALGRIVTDLPGLSY